jgi:hypothetical protein
VGPNRHASGSDPTVTTEMLNRDLQKISHWASKWKVLFNPGKTKEMIFSQVLYLGKNKFMKYVLEQMQS